MNLELNIKTLLDAHTPITSVLTGGIYAYTALDKRNIDKQATPQAYNITDGFAVLKPICVIKQVGISNDYNINDNSTLGSNVLMQFWFYEDTSYNNITNAFDKLFSYVQRKTFADIGVFSLTNSIYGLRVESLGNASLIRAEYTIKRTRT